MYSFIFTENNFSSHITFMDLIHEFPAPPTGWKNRTILKNSHNLLDLVFSVGNHGTNSIVFRTEPNP